MSRNASLAELKPLELLGEDAATHKIEAALERYGTLSRPALDEEDEDQHYDWVLVRRKGVELGFVDKAFFQGKIPALWRSNGLILNQLTFYADTREEITAYDGELPHGLTLRDTRAVVRDKLAAVEATRHSYLTDRWNIENYRLIVAYKPDDAGIDSVHIKLPIQPRPENGREQPDITFGDWLDLFGEAQESKALEEALAPLDVQARIEDGEDEREVSFTDECGLTLYFEEAQALKLKSKKTKGRSLAFGAVKFFRARDGEARQYTGELPFGLDFEDDPETLFKKIPHRPSKHDNGQNTGRALWHLEQCSIQVLYSTIENHLFRVMLMAPGYWQDFEELGQ